MRINTQEATSDEILEHFGVKGMKWGVRKDRRQEKRAKRANKMAKKALRETRRMEKDFKRYNPKQYYDSKRRRARKNLIGRTVGAAAVTTISTALASSVGLPATALITLGAGVTGVNAAVYGTKYTYAKSRMKGYEKKELAELAKSVNFEGEDPFKKVGG